MSFLFGFRKKKNNKKDKNSNNIIPASRGPQCDGNASGSLAEAMLFPMQYNGPTYDFNSFPDELLFIPFSDEITIPRFNPSNLFSSNGKKLNHKYGISALLIHGNPKNNPTHFMILFHGNGVDLGMAAAMWRPLIRALPIHLLLVEYPGYGIMDGRCTCKEVIKVAEHTYKYVTTPKQNRGLGISTNKLIILGRSIGTGPASHIAKKKCHTLILVSPFTSIHNLSQDLMGKWTKWVLPKDYQTTMFGGDDDDQSTDESDDSHHQQLHIDGIEEEQEIPDDIRKVVSSPPTLVKSISNPLTTLSPTNEEEHKGNGHDNGHDNGHNYNKNNEKEEHSVYSMEYENDPMAIPEEETKDYDNKDLGVIKEQTNKELKQSTTSNTFIPSSRVTSSSMASSIGSSYPSLDKQPNGRIKRSESSRTVRTKKTKSFPKTRGKRHKNGNQASFVFNNVTQIDKWQCKNFMVFHGKNDELIPYAHTNTIVQTVKNKKPELNPKKFLIDGVGHNDVNIQFIGLRIFMQYQEELQPSFSEESGGINIDNIVPYLDNPPQFDIITNKVQNFGHKPAKKSRGSGMNKVVKKISSPSSIFGSDDEDEDDQEQRVINQWNQEKGEFERWQRSLPTKIYDLSCKLKLDSQKKQMEKATNVISSKWI